MKNRKILFTLIIITVCMVFLTACNGSSDIASGNVIDAGNVINCAISKEIGQGEYYIHHIKDANDANELMLSYGVDEKYIGLFTEEFFENSELILICYQGNPDITYKVNGIIVDGDKGKIDIESTNKDEVVTLLLQYSALMIEVEKGSILEETSLGIEWSLELAN